MTRRWLAVMLVVVAACGSAGQSTPPASSAQAEVRIARQPPLAKDVIDAAIASGHIPLKSATNCANVGTEPTDATIGRYLAGFLAELSAPDKKNWIDTKIEPGRSASGEPVSICTLMLRHEHGDDRWGWGIQFHVRSSDGLVLTNSFSCVGAG